MKGASGAQKTVVVLGMARSGTSVVTGVLRILGVDVGIGPTPSKTNPFGSFEDPDFLKLNNEIFKSAGKPYWRDPPSYEEILARKGEFNEKIKSLVSKKSKDKRIWGWKRHTTSLIMELYLPHLVNPCVVVVLRNPLGGANSIVEHSKGEIDSIRALKLMNLYNNHTFNFLERHPEVPRIFIGFEDLVSHPVGEVGKLAKYLDVELTEEKIKRLNKFVIPREKIQIEKRKAVILRLLANKLPKSFRANFKKILNKN